MVIYVGICDIVKGIIILSPALMCSYVLFVLINGLIIPKGRLPRA